MATKKATSKRAKSRRALRREIKAAAKGKSAKKRRGLRRKRQQVRVHGRPNAATLIAYEQRGLGARSGGQSGDTQGISAATDVNWESVEELLEEGQSFEAEVLDGVEHAADPDQEEVQTHQVSEDDVPREYLEND